ncbi:MAG: 16S rRNA (uracil(1498)-N(3))-methyltransferase, partial [Rubrobacteraceae bacterium]|nr:16S rRNA (uracil(1498)-N(3))-methyltransferase [Rubrobacteraceae bacterium]
PPLLGAARVAGEVRDGQRRRDLQRRRRLLLRPPAGRLQVGGLVTRTPITRTFLDFTLEPDDALELPPDEADHVLKVLRGRTGDTVEVVDGAGRLFSAELRSGREIIVVEELATPPGNDFEVSLYQAVPKGGRMDLVVEKATEVGAARIVPLLTERGVVNPREGKVGRWRRVAEAASRQSLRLSVPEVAEPVPFQDAVSQAGETGVLLHNGPGLQPVETVVGDMVSLFVGPEGGWSEGELRLAEEGGIAFGSLGPYRLRSETAGIVAVARALAALHSRVKH